MALSKNELLRETLARDLNRAGSEELVNVVDDTVRKVFTVNKDGAVWVFGHSQPDAAYWNGVKHYGSGPTSRIRIRRTQAIKEKSPKTEKALVTSGEADHSPQAALSKVQNEKAGGQD